MAAQSITGTQRDDHSDDASTGLPIGGLPSSGAKAGTTLPDGVRRVADALAERGHAHAPLWLDSSARTSQQAAHALGVQVGQIAKSVVFRRCADDGAVLVVTSVIAVSTSSASPRSPVNSAAPTRHS